MTVLNTLNTINLATDIFNKIYKEAPKIKPIKFKKKETLEELLTGVLEWETVNETDRRVFISLNKNRKIMILIHSINADIYKHIEKLSDIPTNQKFY